MNYGDGNSIFSIRYRRSRESRPRRPLENFERVVTINRRCQIAAINLEQREPFNNHVTGRGDREADG